MMVITGLASRHSRVCLVIVLWLFLGDDTLAEMDLKSDDSTSLCVAHSHLICAFNSLPLFFSDNSRTFHHRVFPYMRLSIQAVDSIRYICRAAAHPPSSSDIQIMVQNPSRSSHLPGTLHQNKFTYRKVPQPLRRIYFPGYSGALLNAITIRDPKIAETIRAGSTKILNYLCISKPFTICADFYAR